MNEQTKLLQEIQAEVEPLVRPEVRARFEDCVRRRFAEWQKAHPSVEVASATMPPVQVMLAAMATDMSELDEGPNTALTQSEH